MFEFIYWFFRKVEKKKKEENNIKSYRRDYGVNNGDEDRYCSEHNGL